MSKYKCVKQHDITDCGAACIATICLYYKKEVAITKLREMSGTDTKGTTILGVVDAFRKLGKISLGEYNIEEIDKNILRRKIAYVPQNIELFTGTIEENLKIGKPDATYEEIKSACKKAGCADFIEKCLVNMQHFLKKQEQIYLAEKDNE